MLEFDVGLCVLSEVDEDGFVSTQVDGYGEKKSGLAAGEMTFPFGMMARQHDPELDTDGEPDASKACGQIRFFDGDRLHIQPTVDPRFVPKLPRLKKGGATFYGGRIAQPSFLHIDGESGGLDSYWPYDFTGDTPSKSMCFAIDLRNAGAESISWTHGEGMMFSMAAGGKRSLVMKNAAGDGRVEVNDDGCVIDAAATMVTGGVSMGNPTAAVAVALAPYLAAYFTALETAITTALGTIPVVGAATATAFTTAMGLPPVLLAKAKVAATLVKAF